MLPADSYLHLTSGWKVAYGAANTLAAITLSLSLVKEVREFFFPVCGKIPAQLFRCIAFTAITRLKNYTQIHSRAAEFQIFPYFIAVGNHDDQPIFSSHKSVFSQQQFRASLVNSNPSVSLAKHWLEMTLQSPERLTVSL